MNSLHFARGVPIENDGDVPVAPQCLRSLSFEPLPRLSHCPWPGIVAQIMCASLVENEVLRRGRLATHLHCQFIDKGISSFLSLV
jgi:hypothetical protein